MPSSACSTLFMKQVLPRLVRPPPREAWELPPRSLPSTGREGPASKCDCCRPLEVNRAGASPPTRLGAAAGGGEGPAATCGCRSGGLGGGLRGSHSRGLWVGPTVGILAASSRSRERACPGVRSGLKAECRAGGASPGETSSGRPAAFAAASSSSLKTLRGGRGGSAKAPSREGPCSPKDSPRLDELGFPGKGGPLERLGRRPAGCVWLGALALLLSGGKHLGRTACLFRRGDRV